MEEDIRKLISEVNNRRKQRLREFNQEDILDRKQIGEYVKKLYPDTIIEYPSEEFLEYAHKLIVENDIPVEEAIRLSLEKLNKDESWYKATKYKPTSFSKKIVDKYKTTRGYRRLVSEGGLETRRLKKSKHTSEHLQQLNSAQTIVHRFDKLEAKIEQVGKEARVDHIKTLVKIWSMEAEKNCVKNLGKEDVKDLMQFLSKFDIQIQEVADLLDIPVRTFKRWLNDTPEMCRKN